MNPTQKQFSLNRGASRKQIPISPNKRSNVMYCKSLVLLTFMAATAYGQQVVNPTFAGSAAPWVLSGGSTYQASLGAVEIAPGGSVEQSGSFFGQGRNILLFRVAGVRDLAQAHDAEFTVLAAGSFAQTVVTKLFKVPTAKKPNPTSPLRYGSAKDFVWVPSLAPQGAIRRYSLSTDGNPDAGVLVDSAWTIYLSTIANGKAAGIGTLPGSTVTGTGGYTALNSGTGVQVTGTLHTGFYATLASPKKIFVTCQTTAGAGIITLQMYDFQAGKWTDPFVTGIAQVNATGRPIGPNSAVVEFDITTKTPARFVDSADSKTVVMRLKVGHAQSFLTGAQPPPVTAKLSNFNVTF